MSDNKLSVVICTWNEEKNLPGVVASVKSLADEIVVVDTESTDNTIKVAENLGCKVFTHKNTTVVEPVRNYSISKASGNWILLLDADEEIPARLASHIKDIIKSKECADYYRIPRKNFIFGSWITSAHWWPDPVYRLFKKGAVTWDPAIHSIPQTVGHGADLPWEEEYAIIHHNYSSISQYITRMDRYTNVQLNELKEKNVSFSWHDVISKPGQEFIRQYFSRHGYKDGLHGLALSLLQAFSELVLYSKLWQEQKFTPYFITPGQVKKQACSLVKDGRWWSYQQKIESSSFPIRIFWKICQKLFR
jgi:(heptosyl)LPS beta-1,4-glucosyltransferase